MEIMNQLHLNETVPLSVLKKKHRAFAHHRVSEAMAVKVMVFRHIGSAENFADALQQRISSLKGNHCGFLCIDESVMEINVVHQDWV